jgi:hypothetical protein
MTKIAANALLLLFLVSAAVRSGAETSDAAPYGAKTKFSVGRTLHFPDFDLTYVGKRRVTPAQYPRGWWIHDFKVHAKNNEQTVSWSAGTGDIGPSRFKVNGADFQIELSHSDKLGALGEDEIAVSPVKLR